MQTGSVFDTIFPQADVAGDRKAFLAAITARYPYFAPARFLLLKETATDDPAYPKQAAATRLFFSNAHWLHFQLRNDTMAVPDTVTATAPFTATEPEPVEIIMPENADNNDDAASISTEVPEELAAPVRTEAEPAKMVMPENADNNDDVATITAAAPEKITEPVAAEQPAEEPAKKTVQHEPMLFEPMHMVDYFASQGIKLSEEAQTADKLGKQLKSFTEWLKTMKKTQVQAAASTSATTAVTDSAIQQLAEKSNTEDEILTESMAEVLTMQGKLERAREVYQKLSLLNPAKSAYFAAKIEQLKGI